MDSLAGRDRRRRAAALARDQDGIASRRQLRGWGLDRLDVRTEVRAGRWHQPSAHTVAFFTGALTERQRWWVALLESGCSDAALDGLTALQAAGLTGVEGALVISCCRGSQPRRVPEAEIRITRWRCRHDVVGAGIPRVRPSAASIHEALWAKTERQAALMLVAPVQQRLIPPDRLARELARIRRHPKRSWVGQVVNDIVDGAQALGELDFAGLCRRRGWPSPSRQVVRRGPRGRWYLDVSFDEYGVVVEIDGIQHGQGLGPVDDALRQNALAMAGDIVLRIPLLGLRVAADAFLDQVEAALIVRGWRRAA
ncbi:MAG: hypothetical protein H0T66_17595 [Geodermatophilaceae bacterium]|nr:hypothetical protein [Geodermatophilaceae bacterium]MDQ3456197.1 endonuclease domain-containing protein [Actinomycetota bacterium]